MACTLALSWHQSNRSEAKADVAILSEQIISAATALKAPAPVDPKTGDVYFPEARLFLPAGDTPLQLTYGYDIEDNGQRNLSISTRFITQRNATRMRSATDMESMFTHVPKLQACLRGIRVMSVPLTQKDYALQGTVDAGNSRTLYLYTEKGCSEINGTATLLKNLQAY
ncbi:MAG TPA: hypothetical protein VD735_04850 [Candidatus Saccharimonadales bacterium]|nr:hypothetical protein [Candidatus Saccharimonadales bacterium]